MISKRIMHLIVAFLISIPMQSSFGESVSSVELTDESIKGFVESIPAVREWNKEETAAAAKHKPIESSNYGYQYFDRQEASSYEAVLMSTRDPYLAHELAKVVKKFGFEKLDDWIYTGERLSNVYLAINGSFSDEEGRKKLNSAAEAVSDENNMPTGYQDVMMGIIGQAQAAIAEIDDISPHEKDLVRQNLPLLKVMFENAQ